MTSKTWWGSLAVVAAVGLTGCGGNGRGDNAAEPSTTMLSSNTSTTSTPSTVVAREYGTVLELVRAAIGGGFACPSWEQDNVVTGAAESGHCSDGDVLMTFSSQADRDAVVDTIKLSGVGAHLLVGPNWIVNSEEAAKLVPAMGGTVVTVDG